MNDSRYPEVMVPDEAAKYIRRSPGALRQLRYRNAGPPYIRADGRIYYLRRDLDEWLAANRVDPQKVSA